MTGLDAMKWLAGILLVAAWFALVLMGKADVDKFLDFVQLVLSGLGAYGLTVSGRPAPPAPPAPPPVVHLPNGDVRPVLHVPGQKGSILGILSLILAVSMLLGLAYCKASV